MARRLVLSQLNQGSSPCPAISTSPYGEMAHAEVLKTLPARALGSSPSRGIKGGSANGKSKGCDSFDPGSTPGPPSEGRRSHRTVRITK